MVVTHLDLNKIDTLQLIQNLRLKFVFERRQIMATRFATDSADCVWKYFQPFSSTRLWRSRFSLASLTLVKSGIEVAMASKSLTVSRVVFQASPQNKMYVASFVEVSLSVDS